MAICKWEGPSNFFVIFACNPTWPEIQCMIENIPGRKVEDIPNIVARVFKLKLKELINDPRKKKALRCSHRRYMKALNNLYYK